MSVLHVDLQVKPFTVAKTPHDIVSVSLDYEKKDKGPVVTLQTATTDRVGDVAFRRVLVFASPRSRVVLANDWKMNSKKKMADVVKEVKEGLRTRKGKVYEALEQLLKTVDSEVLDTSHVI